MRTLESRRRPARRIVAELGVREMTGRGRFRAWGVL
ncbi:helix-turn-helix domain-containing protein [Sinorhizobium meliloti]